MENLESTRAYLFEEILIQLDSASSEARAVGSLAAAEHIEACLSPFCERERDTARREAGGRR